MEYQELMEKAKEAAKYSYSPYSEFAVGACLLTASGKTYSGCNFENSSFGLTICAERNAIGSAISDGERVIKAIAVYSPKQKQCFPCGACRQVLNEFKAEEGLDVITEGENGLTISELSNLFPEGFNL